MRKLVKHEVSLFFWFMMGSNH